ncbi:MAG: twin-arginine translocation signal domain-containing protein [Hamadaea sp.]|uniref:twin-arginine translocation signal domain-containing protein n=1 Tax=Hamadaea sp. TaxID=2024425 RepID=UPI00184DF646|nr:twin-arginine translocation signal domain-containing protein [Hamadaea sp.]NUR71656.1 twin-arginine translocation signal domain-containing protein [Hamadaea sp.]NUT20220.1 twin-arginine translocation signal domain-containing protein [Hamadaea sp.]
MRTPDGTVATTRRDLLRALAAVGAAGVLAGCDLLAAPEPDPDPLLGLLTETRALLTAYDQVIAADAQSAAKLQPIRATHEAHLTALTAMISPPSPTATPSSTTTAASVADLKRAETTAAKTAYDACLATTPARATLLGEIAAARATHLAVLS